MSTLTRLRPIYKLAQRKFSDQKITLLPQKMYIESEEDILKAEKDLEDFLQQTKEYYDPSPCDEREIGDYPRLPMINDQYKEGRLYWDSQFKRDFGEPLQEHADAMDMYSPDVEPDFTQSYMVSQFMKSTLVIAAFFGIGYYIKTPDTLRYATDKVFPYEYLYDNKL